ncbi:MAG TPA: FtsX-like permease family protein [Thermodesulfobacteriota bacterium]|nr:FtsX-like permease family protein [Thermodesulfobacteriota bacterium]
MSLHVRMAWRNIWRNRRRTVLTLSAIAFATVLLVFMLSFQFGSYDVMINTAVRIHTGHVQVQARGYHENNDIRLVVTNYQMIGDRIKTIPSVQAYTYRANAFSLVSSKNRTYGAIVTGIDPPREAAVSTTASTMRQGVFLSEGDFNQTVLGELLAANLKVTVGDEVTILGQGRDGSIAATVAEVKGIYRSGQDEFDRGSLQIPLAFFQEVYAMPDAVHEVVAVCHSLSDVDTVKAILIADLATITSPYSLVVLGWKELMPGLAQGIAIDLVSGIIMYLLLVFVVAFSILNTFLMAIFERTREFGVMMAIGVSPNRLARLLFLEAILMTALGVLIGIIGGSLLTWYFQIHGITLEGVAEIARQYGLSSTMYPRLTLVTASVGPAAVMVITCLSALYPTLKVRKLRPVEAMTYV